MLQSIIAIFLVGLHLIGAPGSTVVPRVDFVDESPQKHYEFGKNIPFRATITSSAPIKEVFVSFQDDSGEIRVGKMDLDSQGDYIYTYNISTHAIRPGTTIYYWYRVRFVDDYEERLSYSYPFNYEDNRFEWQSQSDGVFDVHWYEGDKQFGQMVLNVAHEGLVSAQKLVPLPPPRNLKIYVYSSASELQKALQLGGQPWVAGYANPDLGAVMVSIHPGPEQKLELERQIPHELTHVLLYQATGLGYSSLPTWFNEGLASLAELYANPDYTRALDVAREKYALLPITSLCGSFPQDASGNFLAYAEAASFTRFLQKTYGTSGLNKLLSSYANGLGCDDGMRAAFGSSLREMETRWQNETLGINISAVVFNNLLPYLILLFLILLIPFAAGLRSRQVSGGTRLATPREKSA
ncbi:MAG TPA: peptidase MA family metallohydrolase [Anaerolineaceae bacterium]|nr:peptidase MA family metallohydrolase [Anaerolineaceae bacterium]